MIEELWSTHIYKDNINDKDYVNQLFNYFLINDTKCNAYGYESGKIQSSITDTDLIFNKLDNFVHECVDKYVGEVFKVKSFNFWDTKISFSNAINMKAHYHHEAVISGVFYIQTISGALVLHDPRNVSNRGYPIGFQQYFSSHSWLPTAGDIIIFPSYLLHEVPWESQSSLRFVMPFDSYYTKN